VTAGSVETASGLAAAAAAWRDADPDPVTRAELDQLISGADTAALAARFEGSLAFGTAGIRAEIGAGPMRMNRLVIGRVATGLARYPAGGATVEAVRAIAAVVGGRLGVKASGGIHTAEAALAMVAAGATRIGASSTAAILDGLGSPGG